MSRLRLSDLLISKQRPQTTLSLVDAFWRNAREMVQTYVFTDTLRHHFSEILDTVASGKGQGFWVQAEYGAGKTHFLATLAALLANQHNLWSDVQDSEIRLFQKRLQESHLFPVIVSLRGETGTDVLTERTLLDVILEKGFRESLERLGLANAVQVTAADDYMAWLDQTTPAIRKDVDDYVRRQTKQSAEEYRASEGTAALARLIAAYCQQSAIDPRIATSVKDRLGYLYRQITGLKTYNGLLVVIDEYEGWQKSHPSPAAQAQDQDVLETLAYLLPRDLGYSVYTIVASQSDVPAKLQGSQAGDRFINIPLLATQNEHDYDIIVSRRVRDLREDRLPEIRDHYRYCHEQFDFARNLTEAEFRDTFPFQPRCFEVVRRITGRDLPTARSGISIFWEVVNDPGLLSRDSLIRVADLLHSPHLVEDCLLTPVYRDAYNAYKVARDALPTLDLEGSDLILAQEVLDTLFLWYLANMEHPRLLSTKDLAEATLATSDVLRAEDSVAYVLSVMQSLRQVEFDKQQARFVPAGGEGVSVVALFTKYRERALKESYRISSEWTASLFLTTKETQGSSGMFSEFQPDTPTSRQIEHRNLIYGGDVIVASRWQEEWGQPLPKEDTHFRLVILTSEAAQSVRPQDLQDPRIAVVFPAPLSEETRRCVAEYIAWQDMSKDYAEEKRTGKEAEAVRSWLATQRASILENLIRTHVGQYAGGRVVTRDDLAISARDTMGLPANDRRVAAIVEQLLAQAYSQMPLDWQKMRGTLRAAEAGRVFDGYFDKMAGTAEKAATANFGVALGLSHPEKPGAFAPQQAKALELIEEMLAERKGELQTWRIYERLCAPPYGLPYVVIQLYLLAFIRSHGRVELTLKKDQKLRTRSGQPWQRDRITSSNVVDLEFKAGLERAFDALVTTEGPTWNDTLAYAREVVSDLHATTDPSEVDTQVPRLEEGLRRLAQDVDSTRRNLKVLCQTLQASLPRDASAALDRLAELAAVAGNGYPAFHDRATAVYATPDDLRDDQRTFARLKQLAERAADIDAVKRYLDAVQLREKDRELSMDRSALLAQFVLDDLIGQPTRWDSLRAEFDGFRGRYLNEYQKHHRDTHKEIAELQQSLADVPRRLRALALLNSIEELGPPKGTDLTNRLQSLQQQLQPCPVRFHSLTLERSPVCEKCQLPLTVGAPRDDVQRFLHDVDQALLSQQRILASEAIRRVLARSTENAVVTFVQVVQTANLSNLVDVMNEDLVTFIRVLLAEEEAVTGEFDMRRFVQDYPTLEESDLPKAVKHFEKLLRDAFDHVRKENPDKKTVRLTLK